MSLAANVIDKNRKTDIILVLKPIDGKFTTSSSGLIDNRLFSGENNLHARLDPQTCLWSLSYESGALPGPLKQRWTSWNAVHKFVETYFKNRNIEIVKVID